MTTEVTDLATTMDAEMQLVRPDPKGLATIVKSEVEAQLDAAHRYPRVLSTFVREAKTIACSTPEVAKSCMYTLERKQKDPETNQWVKKLIVGPSIRLAEICSSTFGNLHAGARPIDVDDTTVTCQGVCWDVQRNVRMVAEVKRRITTKNGSRYSDDMIIVTQNACSSIALRNAIFRVIPRALIDDIFTEVREVATGKGKSIEKKREAIVAGMERLGVKLPRMLARVERLRLEDVTLEDIEALIGLGQRIKDGGESVAELFPETGAMEGDPAAEGKRTPIRRPENNGGTAAATPAAATAAQAAAKPIILAERKQDQAEADDLEQAKREQEEDRRGDDPLRDHERRVPPPSDDDKPSWVK